MCDGIMSIDVYAVRVMTDADKMRQNKLATEGKTSRLAVLAHKAYSTDELRMRGTEKRGLIDEIVGTGTKC